MDKLGFKSISAPPNYKATNGEEGVPMPPEDTFDQGDNAEKVGDIFGLPSSDQAPPPDPLSLTIGGKAGTTIDPLTGETVDAPNPFYVPTLQEIETKTDADGNTIALNLNDWDKIEEIYNKKLDEFEAAQAKWEEEIETGLLSPSEIEYAKWLLKNYDESIGKINESLKLLPQRKKELKALYEEERANFTELAKGVAVEFNAETTSPERKAEIVSQTLAQADINHDGWIGEPDIKGSLEINEDKNKGWIVYDKFEKRIISKFDPKTGEPMSKYWTDGETKSFMKGDFSLSDNKGSEDLSITVNQWGSSTDTFLGTDIEIEVPDRIAVKVGDDGKPKEKDVEEGEVENRLIPADFTISENGELIQVPPSDMDDYVQVKVTKVSISTTDEGDHIVKFYSGFDIAAEYRIVDGSDHTISINGEGHEDPLIIDAHKMKSNVKLGTSENKLNELYSQYGIGANEYNNEAFNETMDKFTNGSGETSDQMLATGIVAYNVSGEVIGSDTDNNLVFFNQSNAEPYEDGKPNAEFANIFKGGSNSYNAVFNNSIGDFYAKGVTLAYSNNESDAIGLTSIVVNNKLMGAIEIDDEDDDLSDDAPISPKVFVHATGGEDDGIFIDNGDETYVDANGDGAKVNKGDGDYFYTAGQGFYSLANVPTNGAYDPEADSANQSGVDPAKFGQAVNDFEDAVNDMDVDVEDTYELDAPEWTKGEYYGKTSSFMNDFMKEFEAQFGLSPDGGDDGEEDVSIDDEKEGVI